MSHVALRRVMIRLLHDPAFAARVHADPEHALGDLELTAAERAWLVAEPPAAWRTDPARPQRVLAALTEEYPATCALAAAHVAGFFASEEFHAAVQSRGSLALAFGAHAMRAPDRRVRAVAGLEQAIALVRRAPRMVRRAPRIVRRAPPIASSPPAHTPAARDRLRLTPRARLLHVPTGALALLAALRGGGALVGLGAEDEPVLVVAPSVDGDVAVEPLAAGLAALLARATDGVAREDLLAEARRHGADAGEDVEILAELEAEDILVACTDS